MANADVTRFMDNARISLPGAVDDALRLSFRAVMTEFLGATNIWQEEIVFDTVANQRSYDLVCSEPGVIHRLMSLVNESDTPVAGQMAEPAVLTLTTLPSAVEELTATVSLNVDDPTDREDYPVFPAWILTKYELTILDGLLARMFVQPAKTYTNERLSVLHMKKFRAGMSVVRSEVERMNLHGAQAWRFPSFA